MPSVQVPHRRHEAYIAVPPLLPRQPHQFLPAPYQGRQGGAHCSQTEGNHPWLPRRQQPPRRLLQLGVLGRRKVPGICQPAKRVGADSGKGCGPSAAESGDVADIDPDAARERDASRYRDVTGM